MARMLVLDGADVCRAPVVEFALRKQLAGSGWLSEVDVASRGVTAESGRRLCEAAGMKLGLRQAATSFAESFRSRQLVRNDVHDADLVLTAERQHRIAVERLVPGSGSKTFTWKEALVLASAAVDRARGGAGSRPGDLAGMAEQLQVARGTVALIEPSVATAAFHWQPGAEDGDPLAVADGHAADVDDHLHRHTVEESYGVAAQLGTYLVALANAASHAEMTGHPAGRSRGDHWDIRS